MDEDHEHLKKVLGNLCDLADRVSWLANMMRGAAGNPEGARPTIRDVVSVYETIKEIAHQSIVFAETKLCICPDCVAKRSEEVSDGEDIFRSILSTRDANS